MFRYANRAWCTWFAPNREAVEGLPIAEVLGERNYALLEGQLKTALAGEVRQFQQVFPDAARGERLLDARFVPHVEGGRVIGVSLNFLDGSDRQLVELRDMRLEALAHALSTVMDPELVSMAVHVESTRRLELLADVSRNLSEARLELKPMLETLVNVLASRTGDAAAVALVGEDGALRWQEAHSQSTPREDWSKVLELSTDEARQLARLPLPKTIRHASQPVALIPLRSSRVLGVVALARLESEEGLNEKELALAEQILERASLAIENALLFEQVQQAVKIRDEFLSVAGHELRTPLTALHLHVAALKRGALHNPDGLELRLESVARQGDRLKRLVEGLLDVSRISAGKLTLDLKTLDLARLAAEILERNATELTVSGSSADLSYSGAAWVKADRFQLEQVVTNLLSNAIKYGGGKPISLAIQMDETTVRLSVTDRGIGIAPDAQARVFERFERAVSAHHYAGLGLGLWIVRQTMEAMGGSIRLESVYGEGSTFEISLPRTRAP